eukprot:5571517-Prymnesium_polylepis.1
MVRGPAESPLPPLGLRHPLELLTPRCQRKAQVAGVQRRRPTTRLGNFELARPQNVDRGVWRSALVASRPRELVVARRGGQLRIVLLQIFS